MRASGSPGIKCLHAASLAGNNRVISLGFLSLSFLRTTYWKFCYEADLLLVLWVWNGDLKEQKQPSARSQQMEDVFSHMRQVTERSPGKAGVSLFMSVQVNYNHALEQRECSTWLQLMPADCHELRFWPSCITNTKHLFEFTEIKLQNITRIQGCCLSLIWYLYPI